MVQATVIKPQGRGRPSSRLQRHVVEDLIRATEDALDTKTARELTVREISSAAGTSEAMIRYYFGGKEGLLREVIKEFMERSPHKDRARMASECLVARSVRPLVEELCQFHYSRPSMIKMITVELFSTSSEVKELFRSKYGRCINQLIEHVVEQLQQAGVYRRDINAKFVGMSLLRLIVSPIMESAVTGDDPVTPEVRSGKWEDFIIDTIDTISRADDPR